MTRHINLMAADILPGFGRWQLPAFVVATLVTLLVSGLYTYYQWSERQDLLEDIAFWQQEVLTSQQRLQDFRRANPAMASETELQKENERLKLRLKERETALSGLATQLDISAQGFSRSLANLSSYDLEGIWLTRIQLRDSSAHLGLEGFTRNPGLVPRYLAQLEGSVFEGISIRNLNIQQAGEESSNLWRFSIADTPAAGATPAPGEAQ